MIRDPSDGSVREPNVGKSHHYEMPAAKPATVDPMLEEIKSAIAAGKVKPERISTEWAYQRAWNDGIDFALKQIERIEKQKDQP
jgi:hypothetical protein